MVFWVRDKGGSLDMDSELIGFHMESTLLGGGQRKLFALPSN